MEQCPRAVDRRRSHAPSLYRVPTHGDAPCGISTVDSSHGVVIVCGLDLRCGSGLPSLQCLGPQLDHAVQWLGLGTRVLR